MVLSRTEGGGEAYQGICGVLEGREGGEVGGLDQIAGAKALMLKVNLSPRQKRRATLLQRDYVLYFMI